MEGFLEAFRGSMGKDTKLLAKTYDEVAPYLVSDCSLNTISNMLSRYEDYEVRQFVTPKGENVLGGEYYEFHVDEEALDALILELFYQPK